MKPELIEVNYHRNGVGGTPFFVVLFRDKTEGDAPRHQELFLATYFPQRGVDDEYLFNGRGELSVVSVTRINERKGVGRENRWRSANWHRWIDRVCLQWEKE